MPNYLKHENQLIVWPVLKEVTENDLFQGQYWNKSPSSYDNERIVTCLFRGMEG